LHDELSPAIQNGSWAFFLVGRLGSSVEFVWPSTTSNTISGILELGFGTLGGGGSILGLSGVLRKLGI